MFDSININKIKGTRNHEVILEKNGEIVKIKGLVSFDVKYHCKEVPVVTFSVISRNVSMDNVGLKGREETNSENFKMSFEKIFDVPDFLHFDGEDYMYYGEDPLLAEEQQDISSKWTGFKHGSGLV